MRKIDSFLKKRLWICGVAGVLLGVAARQLIPERAEFSAEIGKPAEGNARRHLRAERNSSRGELHAGSGTRRLQEIVEADAGECERVVVEILQAHDPSRHIELETAFRRWMSFEKPLVVLERVKELAGPPPNPNHTDPELLIPDWADSFFQAWAATNYTEAIASSEEIKMFRKVRLSAVVEYRDPQIWSYFEKGNISLNLTDTSQSALFQLGYERPDLLNSLVVSDISPDVCKGLVAALAGGWAAADPVAANAWVRSLQLTESQRQQAIHAVIDQWIKIDPDAAGESLQDGDVSGTDPTASLLKNRDRNQLRLAAAADPFIDVKGLYRKLSGDHVDGEPIQQNWPAIEADGWYTPDPATSAREAEALPPGEIRDFLLRSIADIWVASDPDAALEFAQRNGIESQHLKESISDETMEQMISDPAAAFAGQAASVAIHPGSKADPYQIELLTWARIDPASAAKLALEESMNSENGTTLAASEFSNIVGFSWAKHDAGSAIEWMETLPDAESRAKAWGSIRSYAAAYDPELVFDTSLRNFDGEERERLLRSSLSDMRKSIGKPAALAQLETANLSEKERQALRQYLQGSE
ncbi:hypothetical protein JIN85_07630 [Luteolibacter pohnpeiensis]|uniref:Uncharacterized protein n=1 Tax=Luteolibacter pohnpeiensis TaxID=454153 RepID=A0A934SAF0_9BACT|nr:hypothetical protein [Luteolibacter pohnpeiensis]MBK1882279.1 hypothetical protein [Luteolibacter pohnpeiensis]